LLSSKYKVTLSALASAVSCRRHIKHSLSHLNATKLS
jgi:hypothetical protein